MSGSKKVTAVVDLISVGKSHAQFNQLILHNLIDNYQQNVGYYHANEGVFNDQNLTEKLAGVNRYNSRLYVHRFLNFFFKELFFRRKSRYIFLANEMTLFPIILVCLYPFISFNKPAFNLILHNNLVTLQKSNTKRIFFRFFFKLYEPKCYVLAPFLEKDYYRLFGEQLVQSVWHPNYSEVINRFRILRTGSNMKIRVGVAKTHQGDEKFIASLFSLSLKLKFSVHLVSPSINFDPDVGSELYRVENLDSLEEYYSFLSEMDIMAFPIDEDLNKRASGVLMDCLSLGKSFIGPKLGMFKDISEQYGLGILYEDYENMKNISALKREFNRDKWKRFIEDTDPGNITYALLL